MADLEFAVVKIRQTGGATGITIPDRWLKKLGWVLGMHVAVRASDTELIVTPIAATRVPARVAPTREEPAQPDEIRRAIQAISTDKEETDARSTRRSKLSQRNKPVQAPHAAPRSSTPISTPRPVHSHARGLAPGIALD